MKKSNDVSSRSLLVPSSAVLVAIAAAGLASGCGAESQTEQQLAWNVQPHLVMAEAALAEADRSVVPDGTNLEHGQQVVLGNAACTATPCFACFQCHGVTGDGSAIAHQPRLAGQVYQYLHLSLQDFASGSRPQPTMHAVASALTDQQMRDVSAYYAALEPKQIVTEVSIAAQNAPSAEVLDQGRNLATTGSISDGVQACGTCHGPSGGGLPPLYPSLAGQYPEYLEHQLRAFKSGTRGGDQLKVMHEIARRLSDEQIHAAAQYYGSLRPVRAVPQPPAPPPAARLSTVAGRR